MRQVTIPGISTQIPVQRESNFEFDFLIVLYGDPDVGKSRLRSAFLMNGFSLDKKPIIDGLTWRKMSIRGKSVTIQVLGGDPDVLLRGKSFARPTIVCSMLVYDITNMESFRNLDQWLQKAKSKSTIKNLSWSDCVLIVGNKCDLDGNRVVPTHEGLSYSHKHSCAFVETNVLCEKSAETAFKGLTLILYDRLCSPLACLRPEAKKESDPPVRIEPRCLTEAQILEFRKKLLRFLLTLELPCEPDSIYECTDDELTLAEHRNFLQMHPFAPTLLPPNEYRYCLANLQALCTQGSDSVGGACVDLKAILQYINIVNSLFRGIQIWCISRDTGYHNVPVGRRELTISEWENDRFAMVLVAFGVDEGGKPSQVVHSHMFSEFDPVDYLRKLQLDRTQRINVVLHPKREISLTKSAPLITGPTKI